MPSVVQEFYRNKNVLLTGGTGFFGKMIIEKLLRTTEVKRIYVIIRPKQGISVEKRISMMFEEEIFCKVREKKNDAFAHIYPIEGDLRKKGLGLSEEDKGIIKKNVNIVFHCGASLNMGAKLSDVVLTNVRGTAEIIEIMKGSQCLNAFVLVSTAYSNCLHRSIEEKFYETPIDPELLIKMTEEIKPGLFSNISSGLTGPWPNSYVFTKAVAENLLPKVGKNLPVALFRPTIENDAQVPKVQEHSQTWSFLVTSTAFEPVPGWTDNLYGPLGILLSLHCGILRVVRGHGNTKADTVPGDMVINALLCFAWDVEEHWSNQTQKYKPLVLNFSGKNCELYMPIRNYVDAVANSGFPPLKKALWHPTLFIVNNILSYKLLRFALHIVPAYILDAFLFALGQKSRMREIYSKLDRVSSVLHHFLTNEWDVQNENSLILWNKLNDNDKKIFNFDLKAIERDAYFRNILIGIKQFVLKEDMSKINQHKQKHNRLSSVHYLLKYILVCLLSYNLSRAIVRILIPFLMKL